MNEKTGRMADLTLCATCGPATTLDATAYWDASGLDQLLFGEWPFGVGQRGMLLPEVNTALDDWPCLEDVLREGSLRTAEGWLLLLTAEALPSTALIRALICFLATQSRPHLIFGRGWRVGAERWQLLRNLGPHPEQEDSIRAALREEGTLDPPGEVSWLLFPRGSLSSAPADLSAAPASAAPWLVRRASECGWPVLDATWSAPLVRPRSMDPPLQASAQRRIRSDDVLPVGAKGGPRLSFLLVDAPECLGGGVDQLLPASTLPWDVVVRELPDPSSGCGVIAAWNDALLDAQGELVWPLWNEVPQLGSIPTLLRCFQPPWVDMVTTAFRIGNQSMGANDSSLIQPGSLVVRREWLELLGGFPPADTAEQSLRRLSRNGVARGAMVHPLPIDVWQR